MDSFCNALLVFAQDNPANVARLETLREEAFRKIASGGGEITSEIAGAMNGKNFTFKVERSADQLFTDLTEVLRALGDSTLNTRCTSFDFSRMGPL